MAVKHAQSAAPRRRLLEKVVTSYFDCITAKDMTPVPYDARVRLRTPLAPGGLGKPLSGRKHVIDFFNSLFPNLGAARVWEIYYLDGLAIVAARADIHIKSSKTKIRVFDRFMVSDAGLIIRQENHYDPKGVADSVRSAF